MKAQQLTVYTRTYQGTSHARSARRQGHVPAIVYGHGEQNILIYVHEKDIVKAMENPHFYSNIVTLSLDKKPYQVLLKAVQKHPVNRRYLHIDFQRVKANEAINMDVALELIGAEEAPGVKQDKGTMDLVMPKIAVKCLPADLPEHITFDVSKMQLNDKIHLDAIALPKKIELAQPITEEHNPLVIHLHQLKVAQEAPEEQEDVADADADAADAGQENKAEDKSGESD